MTKVLTVDPCELDFSFIKKAAVVIKNGGLVAFPTETVYGLGANVFNEEAVKKIFKTKGRPLNKPLAVCISNLDQLSQIVSFIPREAEAIIENFLPGPLTLILPKKQIISSDITASGNNVGIRYPDNRIALALIDTARVPIATTSANISGKPSPCTAQEVLAQLSNKIDLIIDGGSTKLKIVSTVIDFTASPFKILRAGAISKEELNHFLLGKGFMPLSA